MNRKLHMQTVRRSFPFTNVIVARFLSSLVTATQLAELTERVAQFESALKRGVTAHRVPALLQRIGVEDPDRIHEGDETSLAAGSVEGIDAAHSYGVQSGFNACCYSLLERYGMRMQPTLNRMLMTTTCEVDREYGRRLALGFVASTGTWVDEDDRFEATYLSVGNHGTEELTPVKIPALPAWLKGRLEEQLHVLA